MHVPALDLAATGMAALVKLYRSIKATLGYLLWAGNAIQPLRGDSNFAKVAICASLPLVAHAASGTAAV